MSLCLCDETRGPHAKLRLPSAYHSAFALCTTLGREICCNRGCNISDDISVAYSHEPTSEKLTSFSSTRRRTSFRVQLYNILKVIVINNNS